MRERVRNERKRGRHRGEEPLGETREREKERACAREQARERESARERQRELKPDKQI
jgi:hypothetical protein